MKAATLDPIENTKEEAQTLFHKIIDFLYGTKARTNRTITVIFASVIGIKILDSAVVVPYCSV